MLAWRAGRALSVIVGALVSMLLSTACAGRVDGSAEGRTGQDPSPTATTELDAQEDPALELWEGFGIVEGHEAGRYESLRAIVRWSHAVIRGRVERIDGDRDYKEEEGDTTSTLRDIRATVRVTDVYSGDLQEGDTVPVVLGLTEEGRVEERFRELMDDEGIFFISPAGAPRPEFGLQGVPSGERSGNWLPSSTQGVAINDGGVAVFAMNIVEHGFPADLDRIPFLKLEERVRALARDG